MHGYPAMPVFYDAYYTELVLEIDAGDRNSSNRRADVAIELPRTMPTVAWALSLGIGLIAFAQLLWLANGLRRFK